MHPVFFRIGSFEISSFGVMVALGALLGLLLVRRELARRGIDVVAGTEAATAGIFGGLLGAKLLYVVEHAGEGVLDSLFSRGGLSWFGGLVGGIGAGLLMIRRASLPLIGVLAAASPGLALGQAVGRIGCVLVGDDYGRPTDLPWGIAFPEGLPPTVEKVHPTQVYEALVLFPLTYVLVVWRRHGVPDQVVLGRYLVIAGLVRFAIEFIRINPPVVLGALTVAQAVAGVLVVLGVMLLVRARREEPL